MLTLPISALETILIISILDLILPNDFTARYYSIESYPLCYFLQFSSVNLFHFCFKKLLTNTFIRSYKSQE